MSINDNIKRIIEIIDNQKIRLGISYPITLIAVTKTMPAETVKEAVNSGITDIGENRVQEAELKFKELEDISFTKHLIGHLQENKVNKAAILFDIIQSIDSIEIAEKLNKKLSETKKIIPVLIEVNTSVEESKFGINPSETEELIEKINKLPYLQINGFMTVGPLSEDNNEIRKAFKSLYEIKQKMKNIYRNLPLETLSMGMSGDFETAIAEGSNMLRLGRIIFGDRNY